MKNNVITIIKKELARFFGDRRLLISTVFLPGIMIYLVYSFMGSALTDMFQPDEDYRYIISTVNLPGSVSALTGDMEADFTAVSAEEAEDAKAAIVEKELDLLAVFSEDFDARIAAYDPASDTPAPQVALYYNSTRTESSAAYGMVASILDAYETSLANKFDVNAGEESFDLATEKDASGFMFSSMLPMLLMIFLFSGCMAVAPESIAGEKERGTIATMLITPVKRSELVMGKIFALAIMALLSGVSSIMGTLLSLPKLMGSSEGMSAAFYGAADYVMLAAVALSTVLLFVSIISIISAYAKTVKEAASSVMPLMVIVMLVGVTGMFGGEAQAQGAYYLIPIYNSVQSMVGIFSFNAAGTHILITVAVNLVLSAAFGFVLTRMFNDENVMFGR